MALATFTCRKEKLLHTSFTHLYLPTEFKSKILYLLRSNEEFNGQHAMNLLRNSSAITGCQKNLVAGPILYTNILYHKRILCI